MRKTFTLLLCLCFISFLTSCSIAKKKECLNYENFEKFHYDNKIYCLPDNFVELYSKFDFYGTKHQVGYTIGVYKKVFKTSILDNDKEENILFQGNGRYFWFKEEFVFPNIEESNVNKLLIEKLDSKGYLITSSTCVSIGGGWHSRRYAVSAAVSYYWLINSSYSTLGSIMDRVRFNSNKYV